MQKDPSPQEIEEVRQFSHLLLDDLLNLGETRLAAQAREKLFHYTSSAGLLGIVSTSTLFLTDARFLNDSSELRYGRDLAREVLRSSALDAGPHLSEALSKMGEVFDPLSETFRFSTRCYIACFCEDGNLLSQWRGYSQPGDGVAIGFSAAALAADPSLNLRRVEYDPVKQNAVLQEIVSLAVRKVRDEQARASYTPAITRVLVTASVGAVAAAIALLLPQLKNPRFSEEREWRLVHTEMGDRSRKPNFRHNGRMVQPYITAALNGGEPDRLAPIAELFQAPSGDGDLRQTMLRELMLARGYPATLPINNSDTPLRF